MSKSELLKAEKRDKVGTRPARKLRAQGRITASIEAEGQNPHIDFHIDEHTFLAARRHHTHLYEIDLGGKVETALVQELQWDTLGDRIQHVEFKRVRRDVKTEALVELEFVGHPKGGMLNHLVTQVKVRCFPDQIPDSIEVPVGKLEVNGVVLAKELAMPPGIELVSPTGDYKIAVVVVQKIEEPVAAAATEGAAAEGAAAIPAAPGAAAKGAAAPAKGAPAAAPGKGAPAAPAKGAPAAAPAAKPGAPAAKPPPAKG
jgi:large subunit ribosomal protein L25